MNSKTSVIAFILLSFIANAMPARAQQLPEPIVGSWAAIKALPPTDELKVTLRDGTSKKGKLADITDATITLSQGKKSLAIDRATVFQIHRSVPKSRAKQTWIGAFVGTGLGLVSGLVGDSSSGDGASPGIIVAGIFIMAGIGALIGRGLASGREQVLIYQVRK